MASINFTEAGRERGRERQREMDREGGATAQMVDEQLVTRKRSQIVVVVSFLSLLRFFFFSSWKINRIHHMDGWMVI